MNQNLRNSGIDIIGDVPWGTHFCQFYQTKEDLMDILVPYFKAGLENNEFCMWVTSQPLGVEEAKEAIRRAVPDIDVYMEKGQIVIIPYTHWYLKEGVFDSERVLNGWVEKLNQALANGYDGLRLTGNTFWLEKEDWNDFVDYEEEVDRVLGNYQMIALCTYCLDRCRATEIIDVVTNHQFALIKREGKWEQIESSKRKQAEEALHQATERERFLADVVENADVPFGVGASDGRLLMFNQAFVDLTGYSHEELIQKQLTWVTDLTPSEWREAEAARLAEALRIRQPVRYEKEYLRKDGTRVPVELFVQPVFDTAGNLLHYRSFLTDISERKRAETEIEKLSRQRQLALDAAKLGWWHYNPITRMAYWDDGYKAIFGVTGYERPNDEILMQIIHPEDLPGLWADVEAALNPADPKPFATEYRINRPDGQMRWVEAHGLPTFEGQGVARRAVSFVGTVADITDRKAAEEALRESERRMIGVLESMPDAFVSFDADMRYTYLNANAERLQAVCREELIGKDVRVVYPDAESYKTISQYERVIREQKPVTSMSYHAGFDRWVEIRAFPTPDGVSVFYKDVSAQVKAEEALRESEQRFRLALRNAPVSVAAQDRDLRYIWAYNQRTARPEEIIGHLDDEIFTPEEAAHIDGIKRRVLDEDIEVRETDVVQSA